MAYDPCSSFCEEVLTFPAPAGTNRDKQVKCSDFWLTRPGWPEPSLLLHPRRIGDWMCGESYPVTAAQLFLIFTGFRGTVCRSRKDLSISCEIQRTLARGI